ncbi:zinc-binding dehydrogenase [Nocardia concava]|uniref:zinc-binding dehydrogenase n=1 Tax=Nocardia concava TaxID=257281 RepID=UPI00068719E2|nr:zinc-binding dehydrogenase [Nocardia concava]
MRAVVTTGDERTPTRLIDVDEPTPGPGEVLVRVRAVGVNRGELTRAQRLPPGSRLGWDILGTIEEDPADPEAAKRTVVALSDGSGWADVVAVPRRNLAVVEDPGAALDLAALPVAGLTALAAIRRAGPIIGKTVLITGASGGVGGVLLQLAAAGGAEVLSVPHRLHGTELELTSAAGEPAQARPVDVIIDSVGGPTLEAAFELLNPRGALVSIGNTVREPLRLPVDWGHRRPGVTLSYLSLFDELDHSGTAAEDLAWLARRWAAGSLDLRVTHTGDAESLNATLAALRDRTFNGKAVLRW